MKAPNGYGSVTFLGKNRRNPYAVRKTVGFNEKKYPIYLVVGYAPTREDGMMLLSRYNKDPWNIDRARLTLTELFELWKEKKLQKLGEANQKSLKSAFKHCSSLYQEPYRDLRSYHMQDCIDNCGKGYSTQGSIKNLFGHLDHFAFEMDVINKCYSDLITSDPIPETSKQPFTDDEIAKIWDIRDEEWVDTVLVFLYTGFRIAELLGIQKANVDLSAGTIITGVKTNAGKNRLMPIHSKIMPIIQKYMSEPGECLLTYRGKKISHSQYYIFWNAIMQRTGMDHKTHECRHTFRSRLDSAGANKRCMDLLMGHKSKDVGERVYNHKTIQELKTAIELLNYT